jgi:hypothetical protein
VIRTNIPGRKLCPTVGPLTDSSPIVVPASSPVS